MKYTPLTLQPDCKTDEQIIVASHCKLLLRPLAKALSMLNVQMVLAKNEAELVVQTTNCQPSTAMIDTCFNGKFDATLPLYDAKNHKIKTLVIVDTPQQGRSFLELDHLDQLIIVLRETPIELIARKLYQNTTQSLQTA